MNQEEKDWIKKYEESVRRDNEKGVQKVSLSDEEWARQYEANIIKENGGVAPEGFKVKEGNLVKEHVSDEDWIKNYDSIKAKEACESKIQSVLSKIRETVSDVKNSFKPK